MVAQASTDWRQTLETVCPDIVALATPAVLRSEVVEMATDLGCHLLVEKPLATTASLASHIYQRVRAVGVKHAYAATHCYNPAYVRLKELIQQGMNWTTTRNCGDHGPAPLYPGHYALVLDVELGGGKGHIK